MAIRIGCGSWADDAYAGVLYAEGVAKNARLQAYAQRFSRVELNNTYYATPGAAQMAAWAKQTPDGFIFDFKLHRTFSEKPATEGELVEKVHASVRPLQEAGKLGCFLLTLAPSFAPGKHALDEIAALQERLPAGVPLAVEFRHRGWVEKGRQAATLDFLRRRRLVWVAVDVPALKHASLLPAIDEVTNPDLAYLRLHGRNRGWLKAGNAAERHHYDYSREELEEIAGRVRQLAQGARHVHVSVNNHSETFAPKAALALQEMLGV